MAERNEDVRQSRESTSARTALADDIRAEREAKEAARQKLALTGFAPYDAAVVVCDDFVRGKYQNHFSIFIMLAIAVAAGCIGAQTYDIDTSWVESVDNVLWIIFFLEVVIKVVSEGPKPHKILVGNPDKFWNAIDISVVIFSAPFIDITNDVMAVRLLRLFRVGKMTNAAYFPQVKMIFEGLTDALKAASFILLLLAIIFYLFAVVGIYFFRVNDPWHFDSVAKASLTLFRAATLEDYSTVMYVNMYGCDKFRNVYADKDGIHPLTDNGFANPNAAEYQCEHPESHPVFAALYFVLFVLISSFVTMSLFIGAITVSMGEKMAIIREKRALKRRARIEAKQEVRTRKLSMMSMARENTDSKRTRWAAIMIDRRDRENFEIVKRVMLNISGDPESVKRGMGLSNGDGRYPEDQVLPKWTQEYIAAAAKMRKFVDSKYFTAIITMVCVLAAVVVGLETDNELMANEKAASFVSTLDVVVLIIFAAEVVVKLIAEDTRPWMYFLSAWNVFDFSVVLMNMIGLPQVVAFRILRLFRLLKLVQNYPQLSVMASALIMGVTSMWSIGIILVLVFYLFGIAAVVLFKRNDPFHFPNLHISMLSLFRAGTGEDWTDIMYTNMYGCDNYGPYLDPHDLPFPEECTDPNPQPYASAFFFVFFFIMGALIMLNLFVGVITTAMDEANTRHKADSEEDRKVAKYVKEEKINPSDVAGYRAAFRMMDMDNSGVLDEDEIVESFIELRKLMDINDSSGSLKQLQHKLLEACDWDDIPGLMEQEFVRFIHEMYVAGGIDGSDGAAESDEADDAFRITIGDDSDHSSVAGKGKAAKKGGAATGTAKATPTARRESRGTSLDETVTTSIVAKGEAKGKHETPSATRGKKAPGPKKALRGRTQSTGTLDRSAPGLETSNGEFEDRASGSNLRSDTPNTQIKKGKMQLEWLESEVRRLSKLLATKDLENDKLMVEMSKLKTKASKES